VIDIFPFARQKVNQQLGLEATFRRSEFGLILSRCEDIRQSSDHWVSLSCRAAIAIES